MNQYFFNNSNGWVYREFHNDQDAIAFAQSDSSVESIYAFDRGIIWTAPTI